MQLRRLIEDPDESVKHARRRMQTLIRLQSRYDYLDSSASQPPVHSSVWTSVGVASVTVCSMKSLEEKSGAEL